MISNNRTLLIKIIHLNIISKTIIHNNLNKTINKMFPNSILSKIILNLMTLINLINIINRTWIKMCILQIIKIIRDKIINSIKTKVINRIYNIIKKNKNSSISNKIKIHIIKMKLFLMMNNQLDQWPLINLMLLMTQINLIMYIFYQFWFNYIYIYQINKI